MKLLELLPLPRTLQGKFLAITIPLALVFSLSLFILLELNTHRVAIEGLRENLQELVATESAVLTTPLWNLDDTQIELTIAAIMINPDVLGVKVYGEGGQLLDQAGVTEAEDQGTLVMAKDITFGEQDEEKVIGRLEVAMTDKRVVEATGLRLLVASAAAISVVVSIILSALLAHRRTIGTPLERLLESIKLAQQGSIRKRVQWKSDDEMGAVVSAFNEMQARQEAYEYELRTARDTLERRVSERTTQLAAVRDEAMNARIQLTEAIESISEGFSLFDANDCLVLCNKRYLDMYHGLSDIAVPGTPFETIIRTGAERRIFKDAIDRPEEWVRERLGRHRNPGDPHLQQQNDGRWIQISERKTNKGGTVAVFTDITEFKQREEEAKEANRAKSQFLANMSHELRTPLNAIIGFSRLVMRRSKDVLAEKQYGNLEKILMSAEHLLSLINEILDLARIEAGRMDVHAADVDVGPLVDICMRTVEPMVNGDQVRLVSQIEDTLPILITDKEKVKQILINLLSNAAKFTQEGSVCITARNRDEGVDIEVADTGIGIPEDKLEVIFEEFRQVDDSSTRAHGGTGLGLAITRRLARLIGGDIRVRSVLGVGSTFTLSLPQRIGQPSNEVPAPETQAQTKTRVARERRQGN